MDVGKQDLFAMIGRQQVQIEVLQSWLQERDQLIRALKEQLAERDHLQAETNGAACNRVG